MSSEITSGHDSITAEGIDTILHADWVIPVTEADDVLEQHSVLIRGGRIVDIVPQAEGRTLPAGEIIELPGRVLIPGLINAHGHAGMTLLRGIADDLPLHTWLQDHIWPLEGEWVSEEFVQHGSQLAMAEMLRGGTTCFADMYFFPEAVARAATQAGIRVQLASPVFDFPSAWGRDADDYISKATRLHDEYRNSQLISMAFGPHAPYTVSDAPLRRIIMLAEELDIPVHMHIHETAQEVDDAVRDNGQRPLQRLQSLGLPGPRLLAVHATQLNDTEVTMLAETGSHVVHCPQSNLKLASGFCEVQRLQDAGINVALGTDGAASNNDLDLFAEMQTAALLAKAVSGDASALPAHQALRMATLNGARAMGLDDRIGSLEPGKQADLCAVNLDTLNTWPVYNPVSQLVYSSRSDQVTDVWIAGNRVLADGKHLSINISVLREHVMRWHERLATSDTTPRGT
ncbi:MAG: TRZ/ATZ family hydrolase [Pseudohongiellaceae bacterium]